MQRERREEGYEDAVLSLGRGGAGRLGDGDGLGVERRRGTCRI